MKLHNQTLPVFSKNSPSKCLHNSKSLTTKKTVQRKNIPKKNPNRKMKNTKVHRKKTKKVKALSSMPKPKKKTNWTESKQKTNQLSMKRCKKKREKRKRMESSLTMLITSLMTMTGILSMNSKKLSMSLMALRRMFRITVIMKTMMLMSINIDHFYILFI